MSTTLLEVVTPERIVYSGEVNMVSIKTGGGELGILPKHAPLAGTVKPCIVRVKVAGGEGYIHVGAGFLEVLPERVTVLANVAELPEDIDVERAEAARQRAEQRLNQHDSGTDVDRAEAALRRALARLEVVERTRNAGNVLHRPS
ncbi:MAG: F0F1 ATP synthase subunit epsilon [Alicyclobacillus sp.]|nr:F0F1 ATP synthase subunit epsilon [Alicyclobacillus sp.]